MLSSYRNCAKLLHRKASTASVISWNDAKRYKDVPGPSMGGFIRGFLPGGRYLICFIMFAFYNEIFDRKESTTI